MIIKRIINKLFRRPQAEIKQPDIEKLTRALCQTNTRLEKLENDLVKATAGYRTALIKENPDILPELIGGENIEALDKSVVNARELTDKIKKQLESQNDAVRVPAGAPERGKQDTENMSPREKIVYGLENVRTN